MNPGSRHRPGGAFTLIELLVVVAVVAMLIGILLPALGAARNAARLGVSMSNIRQLAVGSSSYSFDHREHHPIRMSYSYGSVDGYTTWNFGGKNNHVFWRTHDGGQWDEPAYSRSLNRYIYPEVPIPQPPGWYDWPDYNEGHPHDEDRLRLQLTVFRSPGDRATYQRPSTGRPEPDYSISGYDDVGTSYHFNMRWWETLAAELPQGSESHTRWAERILALGSRWMNTGTRTDPWRFVLMHDQIAGVVLDDPQRRSWRGEFGQGNRSVMVFLDGRAEYARVEPGGESADGYTFQFRANGR
jgi:prepilin-type N-terminal cleavage/methylation domain-containing protein